jgi:hypothetical protein
MQQPISSKEKSNPELITKKGPIPRSGAIPVEGIASVIGAVDSIANLRVESLDRVAATESAYKLFSYTRPIAFTSSKIFP